MAGQDEIKLDKFVFLVDVGNVGSSCPDERKSVINTHAAKRMHQKRRQIQKQQSRQKRNPTETSKSLAEDEQSDGNKDQLEQPDSSIAGVNRESPTLNVWNASTLFHSHLPHPHISVFQRNNLNANTAPCSQFGLCQNSTSSTRCCPPTQPAEFGLSDKYARHDQEASPKGENPGTQLFRDTGMEVRTDFDQHSSNHLKYRETGLTDSLAKPARPEIMSKASGSIPICHLGSGQHDPFTVYPLICSRENHKVLHFFHNTLAEIVYGYGPAAPLCYLRLVTHHFIRDEATMHLILAFSSFAWSSLFGKDENYERKGLIHMTKGIRLANQRLREKSQPVSEGAIQAAIVMSAIEGRAGNMEGFKAHVVGARQMVKMLGGLDRLSPLLLWQICSSEPRIFQTAGVEMFPCTDRHFGAFLLQCRPDVAMHHAAFKRSPSSLKDPVEEVLEFSEPLDLPPSLYLSGCVTEFLIVTSQFRDLSEARNQYWLDRGGRCGPAYASAQCLSVSTALHSRLASILNPGRTLVELHTISQNATAAALYKHETTRMVCLFHIHAMLWRYRHKPTQTDTYMLLIMQEVQRNGLEFSKSLDALNWVLVWLCLNDDHLDLGKNEMGWRELTRMVLRLMRVALKLSYRSWQSLEYAMFEGLVGKKRVTERGDVDRVCESGPREEEHKWPDAEVVWKDFINESIPHSGEHM